MEQNDIMQARKERILAYIKRDGYLPMKRRDLRVMMDVPTEDRPAFEELLQQLIDEGHIFETKKGKLASPKDLQMATGSFIGHARGFGFVTPDEGGDDVFIPASETMGAMQKDKVLYKVLHKAEKGSSALLVPLKAVTRASALWWLMTRKLPRIFLFPEIIPKARSAGIRLLWKSSITGKTDETPKGK